VADARRKYGKPVDRHNQLAQLVSLDIVVQWVVLEKHRHPRLLAEKRGPQLGIRRRMLAHPDGQRQLASNADVEIRGAVTRKDRDEAALQIRAQGLAHPLTAKETVNAILAPVEAACLALVDQVLEKRRIASDDVGVLRPEELQCVEDLVYV